MIPANELIVLPSLHHL